MITLPLPLISALVLGVLFLWLTLWQRRLSWISALPGAVALQAASVALALHYGLDTVRVMQPVTAMVLPALAWLAWKTDANGVRLGWQDAWHLLGPGLAIVLQAMGGGLLDVLLPVGYAGYALALGIELRRAGPDLPRARLSEGAAPRRVWLGIVAALALSGLSDLGIALVLMLGHAGLVPLIVDLSTSALLLGMGLLALGLAQGSVAVDAGALPAPPAADESDHALFARLEAHMRTRSPWRDPDLSLAQLARRLSVPAKRLSVAVNLVTGDNISRYVNGYRVQAACAALQNGASVTQAMLDAGFLTKSNFNRAFRHVTGQTPTAWRASL